MCPPSPSSESYVVFHYPPELLKLLVDTIPVLCRSKKDVLAFFRGAGVAESVLADLRRTVETAPDSISKYAITGSILERLNAKKDTHLRELREVVRRVTETEDYSTCWPKDQMAAKGFVAEVRRVVNVKDSFTQMRIEKDRAAEKAKQVAEQKAKAAEDRRETVDGVKRDLFALFGEQNAHKRGKALEGVLNRLFAAYGILVKEAFTVNGISGEGIIEQIDGVAEIDGAVYLVEMKWWDKTIGTNEISPHIVRVYGRGAQVRGIFISYSDYSDAAIDTCRQALAGGALIALVKLGEIVDVLEHYEQGAGLLDMLRKKINAALLEKQPWRAHK